jgi:probable addiction module antidote protein
MGWLGPLAARPTCALLFFYWPNRNNHDNKNTIRGIIIPTNKKGLCKCIALKFKVIAKSKCIIIKKDYLNLYPNEYTNKCTLLRKQSNMDTSRFDIADYLDSNEMIAEYLNTVLAEGNDSDVITAIGHIAKSIGMTKIAQETGLSRPSLYKALSAGAKPQFETIMKVLRAIGGQIKINPMTA